MTKNLIKKQVSTTLPYTLAYTFFRLCNQRLLRAFSTTAAINNYIKSRFITCFLFRSGFAFFSFLKIRHQLHHRLLILSLHLRLCFALRHFERFVLLAELEHRQLEKLHTLFVEVLQTIF